MDLDIETLGKEQRKGNIYKGIITRIEPSLEACFVDYGTDRHGFCRLRKYRVRISAITKAAGREFKTCSKKAWKLSSKLKRRTRQQRRGTDHLHQPGRPLSGLMPNNPRGGGVSRRIEGEERQELKAAMAELDIPNGMSIIARTAGISHSAEELNGI